VPGSLGLNAKLICGFVLRRDAGECLVDFLAVGIDCCDVLLARPIFVLTPITEEAQWNIECPRCIIGTAAEVPLLALAAHEGSVLTDLTVQDHRLVPGDRNVLNELELHWTSPK
jgi:hypothetical protein